jgi:ABC-type glycerol-3-phosphate transport system substrate-binding protein
MKRTWLATVFVLMFALVAAACTSDGGDDGNTTGATGATGGEPVHLTMWVGYTPPPPENESHEYLSIERMVNEFQADNPDITIELQYVNSDNALQKATVAIQRHKRADISHQHGPTMPQLA